MAKVKLGGSTKPLNQVGSTSKIDKSVSDGSIKHINATERSLEKSSRVKDVLVKTLDIEDIRTDQDNPRKLEINVDLVSKIGEKYSLETYIKNESENEWIESFVEQVKNDFDLKGKQIEDFKSIVEFANVLKSPDRLLHPIIVWKEDIENIYHLIAGERRLLAHCLLKAKNIASKINKKPSQKEIDLFQWEENESRLDFNLSEKLNRVEKFINAHGGLDNQSINKLQKLTGMGKTLCGMYLKVLRYESPLLREAINNQQLTSFDKAFELSRLPVEDFEAAFKGNEIKPVRIPKTNNDKVFKPSIKVARSGDNEALNKMIEAVVEKYNAKSVIEELDLTKPKDINIALNALLLFLENKEE